MSSRELANTLVAHCVDTIERFVDAHARRWQLPNVFAGHAVGADVRADLLFTLTHLAAAGVDTIAGTPIEVAISTLLAGVDGVATHSFFSYRVAETLLDAGPFAKNPRLAGLSDEAREQVTLACDSSSFLPLLDAGKLPRNYAAVLARCEHARERLGLLDASGRDGRDALVQRVRALLTSNPSQFLDDSNDGSGRYDIYTADIWLFCEPLAAAIGLEWQTGFAGALALVERTVGRAGNAIPWGRSTGVLSTALTVELGAAALRHGAGDEPGRWLRRAADAARSMPAWFGADGVVNAHQHRDQDAYRGPARRLQLTFDLLGKLAWSARTLQGVEPEVTSAGGGVTYAPVDELISFDETTTASVWAYRSPAVAFSLPFVGAVRSHYLPALHAPGRFEVPVDRDLPCWTPLVISGYLPHTAGGLPTAVIHGSGHVTARWDGFAATADTFAAGGPPGLVGARVSTWRVEGRGVRLDDELSFAAVPQAVAYAIPEIPTRPLTVEFECATPSTASAIDVDGIAEWRSSWSQITRVHQLDVEPRSALRISVRVIPKLRIASTAHDDHYDRALYEPLGDRVVRCPSPVGAFGDPGVVLDEIDALHLHWPEWLAFDDLAEHERIAELLADRGIPVVWTAHNLTPHTKQPHLFDSVYSFWAQRVAAMIHHSEWGRARMLERYDVAPHVEHVVLPHGHFGRVWAAALARIDRARAEQQLGLAPCTLRIGLLSAPRVEKRVREFVAGFVAAHRDDVQLAVWSLAFGDELPADPRIVAAEQYREANVKTYATRLAACDVLALPFDPDGEMLSTGTVADAIGVGLPVLASNWGFLVEYLGDARISIGTASADEVTAAIEALTPERVTQARADMERLRPNFEWLPIAAATHDLFDRVVTRGTP